MTEKKSSYEKLKTVTIGDIIDKSKATLALPQQNFQQTSRRRKFMYKGLIGVVIALVVYRFLFFGEIANPWLESLKLVGGTAIPVLLFLLMAQYMSGQDRLTQTSVEGRTTQEFYELVTLLNQQKLALNAGTEWAKELRGFVQASEELPILAETAMDQSALAEMKRQIRETLNENQPDIETWLENNKQVLRPYFDAFQTIISLLNLRQESHQLASSEYYRYMKVLRSQLSEDECYLILVYALFSLRGVETGIDLSYTSFFGDEGEVKDNKYIMLPAVIKDIVLTHFVAHTDEEISHAHRQEMRVAYRESRSLQQNYLKRTSY